jgi:hypothetical protein
MPSTYTTNGGIELPANGEQSGTWGETVNDNMAIIDRLTNGVGAISLSGTTHTLTTADGTLSDGQYNVLVLGGSPSGTNTITISPNDGEHVYIVKNASGQTATFTQGSGANVSVLNNTTKIIYADGAGAGAAVVDITGALDLGSLIIAGTSVTATAAELNILDGVTATAAELNYNDITTLGTVQASKTVTADASGDVLFPDGDKAIFGDSSDLQIYHTGTYSLIADTSGTGPLRVVTNTFQLNNAADTQNMIAAAEGGAVTLYNAGNAKLATTATGIDVTGTVAAGAGTALLPSITTTGDLNTGMWFPAADTIAFSEGGVEALRIDSSGNVGIGVVPEAWSALYGTKALQVGAQASLSDINGDLHLSSNAYYDTTDARWEYINADYATKYTQVDGVHQWLTAGIGTADAAITWSESMRIDSSGNVGIGTSSPDVFSRGYTRTVGISSNGSTSLAIQSAGDPLYPAIEMGRGSSRQFLIANQAAYSTIGTLENTPLIFITNGTERIRITSTGSVGIGTSSPSGELDVTFSKASAVTNLYVRNPDNSGGAAIRVQSQTDAHQVILGITDAGSGGRVGTLTNDDFYFVTNNTERLRIDTSGNVGIGTSSPSVKLEVAGAAKLTNGNLSVVPSTATQAAVTICTNTGGSFFAGLDSSTGSTFGVGNYSAVLYNGANTPLVMFINGTERLRIGTNGYVGFGLTTPTTMIHLNGGTAGNSNSGIAAAWNVHSDYRLKENVVDLSNASSLVSQLRPVKFSWIGEDQSEATTAGFIAHEMAEVAPYSVMGEKDAVNEDGSINSQAADYSKLVPLLTAALQEALNKIDAMETRLSALEG